MPKPHSIMVVAALQQMTTAKAALQSVLTALKNDDIGLAFHNYGMESMHPESSTFKGFNAQGQAMYACSWYDDHGWAGGDGSFVTGTAFVWYDFARNKLLADT
jgi:hypothetical protein